MSGRSAPGVYEEGSIMKRWIRSSNIKKSDLELIPIIVGVDDNDLLLNSSSLPLPW